MPSACLAYASIYITTSSLTSTVLSGLTPVLLGQVLVAGTQEQVQEALDAAEPCKDVRGLPAHAL